jgi:tetratricopeptide (TPR) repeat protein
MTKQEKAIATAFTGVMFSAGEDYDTYTHYVEKLIGRSLITNELGSKEFMSEIKEKSKTDFMNMCKSKPRYFFNWVSVVSCLLTLLAFSLFSHPSEKPTLRTLFSKILDKNYIEAIKDYDDFIKINPNSFEAYNDRGFAKEELNDYKGALIDYNKAIELNPKYEEAYSGRANAKIMMHDPKGATDDMEQAIKFHKS